jgi:glycosyltransferase involved in cell wall biosynthesis
MIVLDWFQWTITEWLLSALLLLVSLIQIYYYFFFYRAIPRHAKRMVKNKLILSDSQPPVSIILTSRDQEGSLALNLPLLLEQDYPEFQVIVVNEASTDDTEDLLKRLSSQYPHLYTTFVPAGTQNLSSKKIALTIAIKAAKYDYLLFTEANCAPEGNQWIASMMRQFTPDTSIVLGSSSFSELHGFFRKMIAFDNLFQSVRYLGMAASRRPYMGIGRNMAYRKDLFFRNKGFAKHLNLTTGEDDLFISDVATGANTRIEVSSASKIRMTVSDAKDYWKEHKINRIYTSSHYKRSARIRTSVELISRFSFYGLFAALIVLGLLELNIPVLVVAGVLFLIRYVIQIVVLYSCAKVLDEPRFYLTIPWFDLILPCYTFLLRLDKLFRRRKSLTRQTLY